MNPNPVRSSLGLGLLLAFSFALSAQPPPAPPGQAAAVVPTLTPDQLEQLASPVALYPDPLLAALLPASTFPADLESAAAYLNSGGNPAEVDGQPWDASVKALAHYPEVAVWMAQNLAWTQALGSAFLTQPADVMQAIQRLRAQAQATGTLASSAEETVIVQDGQIEIEPAQADYLYVPLYDPAAVFYAEPEGGPLISFGPPYPVGIWLTFGCDWVGGGIWIGDWTAWHGPKGWRHPSFRGGGSVGRPIHPWVSPAGRPEAVRSLSAPAPWTAAGWRGGAAPQAPRSGFRPPGSFTLPSHPPMGSGYRGAGGERSGPEREGGRDDYQRR